MSGISFLASRDSHQSRELFRNSLKEISLGRLAQKHNFTYSFLVGSLLTATDGNGRSSRCNESGIQVIVDGYFVESLGTQEGCAEWFLRQYKLLGDSLFGSLNGSYNVLIVNEFEQNLKLVSDRYGTRPLFYFQESNVFSISPFSRVLTDSRILEKRLNTAMVANQLSYSRVWIGDDTFFKGIHSFPSGTIATWSLSNGLSLSKYRQIKGEFGAEQLSIDELSSVFVNVIEDFNQVDNVGLSLSGGLDSRILLAAGFKGNTYTWGYNSHNSDIALAKESADVNGNPWHFVGLKPRDFLDINQAGDEFREGLDLFVQGYSLGCYERVRETGVGGLITGLALDFTMAGSYLPSNITSDTEALSFIVSKSKSFNDLELKSLIKSSNIQSEIDNLYGKLNQFVIDSDEASYAEKVQSFFMESRVRRYIFQRQQWQRLYLEDYIPTFDNRIVDYLSRYDLSDLYGHKIFKEVLEKLSPELSNVRYQGTMLPPSAPVDMWEKGARIELEREKLYREIYAETKGRVFIPYDRYYSNFDEWMRKDQDWISYINNILFSGDAYIAEYVDMDTVKSWVESQKEGRSPMYSKIIQLVSLEKTLRAHF